jgi:predicted protein tyrosine phosphatase
MWGAIMRLAQIKNGAVVNIIKVDPDNVPDFCKDWPLSEAATIGCEYDGTSFSKPASLIAAEVAAKAKSEVERVSRLGAELDNAQSVAKILLKISFLQENRIRVLEGKAKITVAQFRAWVDEQIS